VQGSEVIEIPFLNYYKTICWSVYKQLAKKGFEVRYIADQDVPQSSMATEEDQIKYSISISKWQNERSVKDYIKPKDASVLVLSSLSNIEEVKDLVEKYGNEISFVFVPLTESLNKQHIGDWIQWLFVQQEKDNAAVYKTNRSLSLLRKKIEENEEQLQKLLEQYQRSTVLHKAN
jgi:UDP-N-acetylglucosamine:LPS N-acetylglucosamine transferase